MNSKTAFLLLGILFVPVTLCSGDTDPKIGIGLEVGNSGISDVVNNYENATVYGATFFWIYGLNDPSQNILLRPSITIDYYRQNYIFPYSYTSPSILESSHISPTRVFVTLDFRISPKWLINPYWEPNIGVLINNNLSVSFLLTLLGFGLSVPLFDNKVLLDGGLNFSFSVSEPTSLLGKITGRISYVF